MLAEFLAWWVAQMRGVLPALWLTPARPPDALIIALRDLNAVTGALWLRRNGEETQLQTLPAPLAPLPRLPLLLRLPAGVVLSREVTLPLAAAADLRAVIGFEMDRLTPFSADEIVWRISGPVADRARELLRLRLTFVPRAMLAAPLAALAGLGLAPAAIEMGQEQIPLGGAPRAWLLRRCRGWAAVSVVLALACVLTPFLRQQMALAAAEGQIASHAVAAHQAEALRRQLAIARSSHAVIAKAGQGGDVLRVLAMLTDALPDGTWLSDLTIKNGELSLDGQSADAAKLIARLAAAPGVKDPGFTAPVTRSADGKRDQFSLHARLSG